MRQTDLVITPQKAKGHTIHGAKKTFKISAMLKGKNFTSQRYRPVYLTHKITGDMLLSKTVIQ